MFTERIKSETTVGDPSMDCPAHFTFLKCLMGMCFTTLASFAFSQEMGAGQGSISTGEIKLALLSSGRVIEGRITQSYGEVKIERSGGTEIILNDSQVLATDVSHEGLHQYWIRNRPQLASDPLAHALYLLDEADWCLQHDMLDQAKATNRQLQRLFAQTPFPNSLTVRLRSQILRLDRSSKEPVEQTSRPTRLMPVSHARRLISQREAYFSSHIMPILNNRCLGCHRHPTSNAMPLVGPHQGSRLSDSHLRDNVSSVDEFIETDRNARMTSLYLASSQPHGGQPSASLTSRNQVALAHLAAWIEMSQREIREEQTVRAETDLLVRSDQSNSSVRQVSAEIGIQTRGVRANQPPQKASTQKTLNQSNEIQATGMQRLPVVENPHDAAIFNRMHHGHGYQRVARGVNPNNSAVTR